MQTVTHEPLGVTVTGVSITGVDDATITELRALLGQHGVLVFPGQQADDAEFLTFLQRFGELTFTTGETPVDGFPDLNVISNVGRATAPRSSFHTDSSYLSRPPTYTALRAVTVPRHGGGTVFTNQYRAYETLPPDVRASLQDRTITHVVTGLDLGDDDETAAVHPICRTHPLSGRTALYLSTPQRCAAISGMPDDEAADLVQFLLAHSTRADNVFEHAWSPGDVVMWDNGCVLHRADHSDVEGDRVMHRGMVIGYEPVSA
ncbi:TauD/TfdA dioxygenase family protein [uncultured Jatrophihabitans sp.]|uniref:TauD/TfdA dioxygenase family protein n=1 Tax=uncultured Jatrophihabitans sp. TaxID=1610747 RepID=UPI0035CB3381